MNGKVFLVGAGPGDPDLLTVRAMRLVTLADVVVYDRLISEAIMALVPAGVTRIPVGKSPGHHSVRQDDTNRTLVNLARAGRRVVRLKGGDPFVFGRGGEEALYLERHGVPFEIVPGITAAVACTAYAGIPLTHRGMSRGFHVVTGHLCDDGALDLDWRALSDPESTLVIYMGIASLAPMTERLVIASLAPMTERLVKAGLAASTPAALIQEGTTCRQRVITGTLGALPELASVNRIAPPALVVIGRTVSLADDLRWFAPEGREEDEPMAVWAGW